MTPGNALVVGSSQGLGLELCAQLLARGHRVFAATRDPSAATALRALASEERLSVVALELTDPASIEAALGEVAAQVSRLHLVMNVAGLLHGADLGPERKVEELDLDAFQRVFAVNAFGPALVVKHALPLLRHSEPSIVANLSARVGSISDNRLGGWYAYRASKAAQNQLTKTLAVEFSRRAKHCAVVALHPGTVDTGLSKPFQRHVPPEKLFSTERAARQLLEVLDGVTVEQTGQFFAWDGSPIPW